MLKTRVITALILMAVLLPTLFLLPPIYIGGLFLLVLLAAAWEWSRLLAPEASRYARIYSVFFLVIILFFMGIQNYYRQF
jgi:phosphatidate cytidylyltransferase